MKKLTFLLSALALLGLAACTEQLPSNPNYNPSKNEVNTNFIFNVATNVKPTTKQTAGDVQASVTNAASFRGIDNGKLIAFTLSDDGKIVYPTGGNDTQGTFPTVGKLFDLPTIVPAGSLTPDGSGSDKSRRVLELSIPVGTNAFMMYGKAIKTGTDDAQGKVDFDIKTDALGTSKISLQQRYDDTVTDTKTEFEQIEDLIGKILTSIVAAKLDASAAPITFGSESFSGTVSWKDYATYNTSTNLYETAANSPVVSAAAAALEEILGKVFSNFVNIRQGAVRAGSGQAVARQIGDMVVVLGGVANASATSLQEAVAVKLAQNIVELMSYAFITGHNTASISDFSDVTTDAETVDWRSATFIRNNLSNLNVSGTFDKVTDGTLKKFPTEAPFNLPMGSAQLHIDASTLVVSYASTSVNPFDDATVTSPVTKFVYPAELMYFGNSPIRVTDETLNKEDYPDGAGATSGEWLAEASWASKNWTARGSHVLSSTRSVAMADNVNYGSSLLKTTVKYADDVTKLLDNTKAFFPTEDAKEFAPDAGIFELTGILIGGQNNVGWDYIPLSASDNYIVYDKFANAISIPAKGTTMDPVYTLVLDNYINDTKQSDVYVALEFVNKTEKDFWGEHNVIRKGGTFYIAGKLAISKATNAITWPAEPDFYALPPYDANGATIKTERIFIQDYMTEAVFKLGAESLKKAYVTVPDLRSGQITFGLSVDLKWRTGLSFEILLGE